MAGELCALPVARLCKKPADVKLFSRSGYKNRSPTFPRAHSCDLTGTAESVSCIERADACRPSVQVVNFHQSDTGSAIFAAFDRGVGAGREGYQDRCFGII